MDRYYINENAQPTGEHEVHIDNGTCSNPPLEANRIDLGLFNSCEEAIYYARLKFPGATIDGCEKCIPRCHKI